MAKLGLEQSIQCSRALIYAFVHIILWDSLIFYFCVTKALISIEIYIEYVAEPPKKSGPRAPIDVSTDLR